MLEPLVARNCTTDRYQRILLGGSGDESRGQVAGAWPRGDQNYAWRARQPTDRRCHKCGVLFVAANDEFCRTVEQRIENGIDLGAGDTKDVPDAGKIEGFNNALGRASGVMSAK